MRNVNEGAQDLIDEIITGFYLTDEGILTMMTIQKIKQRNHIILNRF